MIPGQITKLVAFISIKGGPLTWPCYVFNNSYYTTAPRDEIWRIQQSSDEAFQQRLSIFLKLKNAFRVVDWQPGYEFDHDLINQNWSENIRKHQQERNGLANTLAGFSNPAEGDFTPN